MAIEVKSAVEPSDAVLVRVRVLAALGDPIRLSIVDMLAEGDRSPDQLAAAVGITGNLLAHHLKVLQEAGLIKRTDSQNDRRRTYVQLDQSALASLLPKPTPLQAPRVVFVCTHNSARSILAEAAWRQVSDVPSASAGSQPASAINPRALSTAKRAGLDIPNKTPQSIDTILRDDDIVISVCDAVNEHLPNLDQPHFHWSIPDPSRIDTDAAFAAALEEITSRIDELAPRVSYRPPKRRVS
ncbi:MAG: helix-turn-helix domain-containing protein [Actinomycetota bacterium]|nr:helix-turn-helix domain-containing protein [Actinomycetota bacterium]